MLLQFVDDLHREKQSAVVHRNQDTGYVQILVVMLLDAADGEHQLGTPLKREEFALHRNDNSVACGHGVDGQHSERRRTVDDDVIVSLFCLRELLFHDVFAVFGVAKLIFCACKCGVRRNDRKIVEMCLNNCVLCRQIGCQNLENCVFQILFHQTNAAGCVTLRVKVDQKYFIAQNAERSCDINRGCGLPDPTFLVCERNNFSHGIPFLSDILSVSMLLLLYHNTGQNTRDFRIFYKIFIRQIICTMFHVKR